MSYPEEINKNRTAFIAFNSKKYDRFQQLIGNDNTRRIINCIPLLLSVNHTKLPGYVSGEVPGGICGYEADDDSSRYIRSRFRLDQFMVIKQKPFVEMLSVMGSIGTIAYTKDSDYDYWVCVDRKSVSLEAFEKFRQKVELIQEWVMNETGNEVHLFINDIEHLQNNIFAEDDKEALGSTVGAVLKDEFFRSSILIAGRVPFWWVVPLYVNDGEYLELFQKVCSQDGSDQYVDLGNLFEIDREDFLGAALFQLVKALDNPFKSILKIGVLEKYLFGGERFPLLAQKVKSHVQKGDLDMRVLDSYIMMFEEVYNYYSGVLDDPSLLKILRQNLYLKINPQISKYSNFDRNRNFPYGVSVMLHYMHEWGWSPSEISRLDSFNNWDYTEIMQYWNRVKAFMLLSYQRIARELPTLNLANKITDSDFKLLSRKIKTNFTSEPDKIDYYITFKETPHESILYIDPVNKGIHEVEWKLQKRTVIDRGSVITTIIKTEADLVRLLAWTAINKIYDPTFTRLKIQSGYSRINQNLVTELLNRISNLFVSKRIDLSKKYMLKNAFRIKHLIIVNFNVENAGAVQSVYYLNKTSWGESYIQRFQSEKDLINVLKAVLADGLHLGLPYEDYCVIDTPEPYKKLYKSLITLFRESYAHVIGHNRSSGLRIITRLAENYILITRNGDEVSVEARPGYISLMAMLSLVPLKLTDYMCIGEDIRLSILQEFFNSHPKNSIRIFYEYQKDYVICYIINESGNIFTYIKRKEMAEEMICYIFSFCRELIELVNSNSKNLKIQNNVYIYCLKIDRFGKYTMDNSTAHFHDLSLATWSNTKGIRVEMEKNGAGALKYILIFPDGSRVHAASVQDVVLAIRELPASARSQISPLIRDVRFSGQTDASIEGGSNFYLLEKSRLELIIDRSWK